MVIKKVEDFDSLEFKLSMDIYKCSFPSNETRPVKNVIEMLKNDTNYHLYISLNDNSVVGVSLLYIFRSLRIGLLDYMAVLPDYQGRGTGKELFNFTFEKFSYVVPNGIGLLMEIQREKVVDPLEGTVRKNRIRFYNRLGAKLLDGVNYLLPPMQDGIEAEELYLMIKPIEEIHYLRKESVVQYIKTIYTTIYQYTDSDLLDKISRKLPEKIMLRNMVL